MKTFFGMVDLSVKLGPSPGKGVCLQFHVPGDTRVTFREVADEIAAWVQFHCSTLNSPLHEHIRNPNPFIQSNSGNFLMIEFWTGDWDDIVKFIDLLRGRFEFTVNEFLE